VSALCQIHEAGVPCFEWAASTWNAGCVHEHLTVVGVCADHEWRMTGRPWNCTVCKEGDEPHVCAVLIVKAPSTAPAGAS
jgi:hypothetical protein